MVADGYACCTGTPAPVFQSIIPTGNSVTLTWSATPGITYRLQYKTDLGSSTWNDVPGDVLASGITASQIDTNATDPQRYYRVVQLP
jgi:hypothetical protein